MKQTIFLLFILCMGLTVRSFAQTANGAKAAKQLTVKKNGNNNGPESTGSGDTVSLMSTTANQAYGETARRFSIADPTINLLNQRANGSNVPISHSGVIGMPRGSYGFANGKILLRPTTATSSGTAYGSGAVASGTSIMGVGTGENTPGVNGKNPYAGPSFWGSRLPARPPSTGNGTGKQ